jgi:TPR repeat protein
MSQQPTQQDLELVRAAAERGVCEAQLIYGQMLLDGTLLSQNHTYALHWFERAARGGSVMAMNMVGRCLDQGWGVVASPQLAAPWFRKAAEKGLDWGMYNLATLLALGSGVPEDKVEALAWLRRAGELNHAKSINLIGGFYEDGWVVEKNMAIARDHYRRAAEGGDFRGQFNYARMLALEGDETAAVDWLRKVPETATPAFLVKMKRFFAAWPSPALQQFVATLPEPQEA